MFRQTIELGTLWKGNDLSIKGVLFEFLIFQSKVKKNSLILRSKLGMKRKNILGLVGKFPSS